MKSSHTRKETIMAVVYSSLSDDFAGKKAFFTAQNSAVSFKELRGKKIEIKDIVITEDDAVDTDTGEVETRRAITVIDKDGKAYGTSSQTVVAQIQRLVDILGDVKSWPEPVAVEIGSAKSGRGREYTTVTLA
nr:MAG TPA: Single stranded DNA binding protein [Caudoviricetes sp.]